MRLIIAVEPPLLATALARALAGPTVDVVVGGSATQGQAGAAVAIVSGAPGAVEAETVISLPDDDGGSGIALVRSNGSVEPVRISSLDDLRRVIASVTAT